jgi:DNA-binding PucR family transcriptional regulator
MEQLPWFAALPPAERSHVGLVVHAALDVFADWLRQSGAPATDVFAVAPRELARVVSLKQTVQLIRVTVDVVEAAVPRLVPPQDEQVLREAVLRYSREIAFAAAEVYAASAEARGAWDARLEAGVVDALVRGHAGELTLSRAASLGWGRPAWVVALAAAGSTDVDLGHLRASARSAGLHLLAGESASSLVLVLGGAAARRRLVEEVYQPLHGAGGDLLETAAAFLEGGSSVEGTARAMFVHANTVRHRLKKVLDVVGRDLGDPRDALVVRMALVLGRTTEL